MAGDHWAGAATPLLCQHDPSASETRRTAVLTKLREALGLVGCRASPVRNARLSFVSGWSVGYLMALRSPLFWSIRAAHNGSDAQSLISISTPAGRSRLIRASTVLAEGLTTSISRLWVRRSNCSRLSLYLWTARRMVTTSFLVGRGMGPETVAPLR